VYESSAASNRLRKDRECSLTCQGDSVTVGSDRDVGAWVRDREVTKGSCPHEKLKAGRRLTGSESKWQYE
jgi:hypothetical protein